MEAALELDGGLQEAARDRGNKGAKHQRPQNSRIVVTIALSMLCYARNGLSNALQVC